ncbi:MAG TPA: hypothetical protein DEA55_08745 [Rhodospirillaceae bacterium]|nr:hypothetical protein [Rhodospirillaceae bacterium]
MFEGKNYYEILGVPQNATQREIQSAWRTLVKQHHEDLAPDEEMKSAYKKRMFVINEAYEILGDEELRKQYDNKHELNGGSNIEWVQNQLSRANEILSADVSYASERDIGVIEFIMSESFGDYRYQKNVQLGTDWMLKVVQNRPDMAGKIVATAFKTALHKKDFRLLDALLEKAPGAFRYDKVHRFAETLKDRGFEVSKHYLYLAHIFCARYTIARNNGTLEQELKSVSEFLAAPALQEQVSGDPGGLLLTLLKYAPQTITQAQFDSYNGIVYQMTWTHNGRRRSQNEEAIKMIMEARPDLKRLPQEAYEKKLSSPAQPSLGEGPS